MRKPVVGFIGLGAIGTPIAAHVVRVFDTVVWNRTSSKAARAGRGVGFVDAPVSGGAAGAEAGTLTVMLGGAPDDRRPRSR